MSAERRLARKSAGAPQEGPRPAPPRANPFGAQLRSARVIAGVTLEAVTEATKITRRHLEALERSDLGALPAPPFTRGFIQAYATLLGLDSRPILDAYREQEQQRGLGAEERERRMLDELSHLAAQRSRGGKGAVSPSRAVSVALALVGLLVLGAAAWFVARGPLTTRPSQNTTATAPAPAASKESRAEPRQDPTLGAPGRAQAQAPGSNTLRPTGSSAQSRARSAPAQRPVAPPKPAPKLEPRPAPPAVAPARAKPAPDATNAAPRPAADAAGPDGPAAVVGLEIPEHGVGTAVVDRRLQGRSSLFAGGTTVSFWTLVTGARPGQVVRHAWFENGRLVMKVDLRVASGHFRTHSRLPLPRPCSTTWAVEARTADGRLLARDEFACESPGR